MVQAYSFAEKKHVEITNNLNIKQYSLPNGNTTTIATGKSKNGDKLSVILTNQKYKNGKPIVDNSEAVEYVKKVFKNVDIIYKDCGAVEEYKEKLKQKCISFLGYNSPTKNKDGCVAMRFGWLMEKNPKLEQKLTDLGCKIPVKKNGKK